MLTAAVVGLGWWGKQIVACLDQSDKIRITHAVDIDIDSVKAFTDKHDLKLTDTLNVVLDDPTIDAVILVTPHGLHKEQVLAAAAAGKQIFCEKPLALSTEAAKEMLEVCRKKNIIIGVGHERRYERALEEIKQRIDSGSLGTLTHLECNWSHNNFASSAVAGGWRQDPKHAPAGTLTALGVHITDYFQSLAGPVHSIYAQAAHRSSSFPGDDVLTVQFKFKSGVTGTMTNIATTPFYCRITVFGDQGWAEAREISNVDIPDPATLTVRDNKNEFSTFSYDPTNTVRENFHAWADAVEGRETYRFTEQQKIHNVEILESILRSIETGKPVRI